MEKRSCALRDKFSHPVYGMQCQWYVNFVLTREDMSVHDVIHSPDEEDRIYDELHDKALMDMALEFGWIAGYYIVPTKRTYPRHIKTVRLVMPDGADRRVWKLLLGNRGYNELHKTARRLADPESDRITPRPVPPPRSNTYHGKNFRPGGGRHPDPTIKETSQCP